MVSNSDIILNIWLPINVIEVWRWEFCGNVRLKMSTFESVDIDLHLRGHMLKELDDQALWDYFVNIYWNLLNEWFRMYSTSFRFFHLTNFPPGKWRLSWSAKLDDAANFFIEFEYLDYHLKHFWNWLNSFWQNWLYVFSSPLSRGGKESNFCGKRLTWIEDQWDFATDYSHLRDWLAQQ